MNNVNMLANVLLVSIHDGCSSPTATLFEERQSVLLILAQKELLNQDVTTNRLGKRLPTNRTELMAIVRSHMYRRQKQPQVIRNLFREEHIRYAA